MPDNNIIFGCITAKYFLNGKGDVEVVRDLSGLSTTGLYSTETYEVSLYGAAGSSIVSHNATTTSYTIGDYVVVLKANTGSGQSINLIVGGVSAEYMEALQGKTYISRGSKPRRGFTFTDGKSTLSIGSFGIEIKVGGQAFSEILIGQATHSSGIIIRTSGGGLSIKEDGDTSISSKSFSVISSNVSIGAVSGVNIDTSYMDLSGSFSMKGDTLSASIGSDFSSYVSSVEQGYFKQILLSHSDKSGGKNYSGLFVEIYKNSKPAIDFDKNGEDFEDKQLNIKTDFEGEKVVLRVNSFKDDYSEKNTYPVLIDKEFLDDLVEMLNKIHTALDTLRNELLAAPITISPGNSAGPVAGSAALTLTRFPAEIARVKKQIEDLENKLNHYRSDVLFTSSKGEK